MVPLQHHRCTVLATDGPTTHQSFFMNCRSSESCFGIPQPGQSTKGRSRQRQCNCKRFLPGPKTMNFQRTPASRLACTMFSMFPSGACDKTLISECRTIRIQTSLQPSASHHRRHSRPASAMEIVFSFRSRWIDLPRAAVSTEVRAGLND